MNIKFTNLYKLYPRANRKYLPENNQCKTIAHWGLNLTSTVNYPKFTIIIRHMVEIPSHLFSMLGGLLISDAWMEVNKTKILRSHGIVCIPFFCCHNYNTHLLI